MKRLIKLILSLLVLLTFVGCGGKEENKKPQKKEKKETEVTSEYKSILDDLKPYDGEKLKIAFIGDSNTFGYTTENPEEDSYPGQLAILWSDKFVVGNYAKSGSYAIEAESEYNWRKSEKQKAYKNTQEYINCINFEPDVVIIMLGTNDMRSIYNYPEGKDAFIHDLAELAREFSELDSVQKVYLATALPCHVATTFIAEMSHGTLQGYIKEAAAIYDFDVIDIYEMTKEEFSTTTYLASDKLHFKKAGHTIIANAFYEYFKKK